MKRDYIHISMTIILSTSILVSLIYLSRNLKSFTEGFEQPGKYPISVDKPLLYDSYKLSENPGISINDAQDNYIDKPVFPANSYIINNIRYWRNPSNGTCTPPDMCGNLYMNTSQNIPQKPTPPNWDSGTRVNFYDSDV